MPLRDNCTHVSWRDIPFGGESAYRCLHPTIIPSTDCIMQYRIYGTCLDSRNVPIFMVSRFAVVVYMVTIMGAGRQDAVEMSHCLQLPFLPITGTLFYIKWIDPIYMPTI